MINNLILISELKSFGLTLQDYFNYLRREYLVNLSRDTEFLSNFKRVRGISLEKTIHSLNLSAKSRLILSKIARSYEDKWDNLDFHKSHILDTEQELSELFPQESNKTALITQGYTLSLMPLHLVIADLHWLHKLIPKKDFFIPHPAKNKDPYGIFEKGARIIKDEIYLGSQKFSRSFLMNITSLCPHGCVDCYKGHFTRVRGRKFYTDLKKAASIQSKKLVEYLNEHSEIVCVIISGGEPLLIDNSGLTEMLSHFKRAQHLAEIRICTGTIFQGEPFRIDEKLLSILQNFQKKTRINIHFNVHLNCPSQFTPEALFAIYKIRKYGFYINSQVPLQEGVNIFRDNLSKTIQTLYKLAELQGRSGIRPYKYILHMNSGSLEYSVPLEFILKVIGKLKYQVDHPLPETWQPVSFSILCKEGNILLSPQMSLNLKKQVFSEYVEYSLPVPENGVFREIKYREPLMKSFNY